MKRQHNHFHNKIKSKIGFLDVTKLLSLKFGYFAHCGSALTLPTHRYKNKGSMMSLESCLQLTAKIFVEWVVFADVTLEICMPLAMSCATRLRHGLVSVLGAVHRWWSFSPLLAGFITATVQ
jgi:hypothetical protein